MSPGDLVLFTAGALRGHRLRTALSLLGVAIGVAAVVVLTALGEGARTYVVGEFASMGTNLLIVVPGKTDTTGGLPGVGGVPHPLTLADAQVVERQVREAERVAPVAMGTEMVSHLERHRQVAVVGATPEYREVRELRLSRGSFLSHEDLFRGSPAVVLGAKVARELFPGEDPMGAVVRVGGWRMRVIGVLAAQGVKLGVDMDEVVVVPVATAMAMLDRDSLFRLIVQIRSHEALPAAKRDVAALLARRHGEEDVTVLTQDALVSTFSTVLTALTLVVAAIAAISLTVAGLGIMNVMLVSVAERTREIGLLRAVGVTRSQVLAAFLTESALLSASGGLVGLVAGWALVRGLVAAYPSFPAHPPTWAVAAAVALSIGVGLLFGFLPARRATRLDPVVALGRR